MSTDFTDDQLVQRFKAGDESALDRLDGQYRESIVQSLSHLVTREVAEDLYQESLLKAAQVIHTFHGGNFRAWLYQIAKNRGIDYLRKQRQSHLVNWDDTTTGAYGDPAYQLEAREIQEKIDREISALPPRQQAVTRLRLYDDLKFSQIADVVGGSSKTIKALFHHARRRLQDRVSLYLTAIYLPFQQLSRMESLLPTISKPAIALTVIAMATILTTDKPLRQMSPVQSHRHPDLRLAGPPAVPQLKQRFLNSPISPAFAAETQHFSSVVPVLSDPSPSDELRASPLSVHSTDLASGNGFHLTKRTRPIASPIAGLEPSVSTPLTRATTTIDEIPHLDSDAAERALERPLLHSRKPGGMVTNRMWVRIVDSSQSSTNESDKKRKVSQWQKREAFHAIYTQDAEQVKQVQASISLKSTSSRAKSTVSN